MQVDSILTPLIAVEIPDLLRWIHYTPSPFTDKSKGSKKVTWFLSLDGKWDCRQMEAIAKHAHNSNLRDFSIQFLSCNIDPSESVYLRSLPRSASCGLRYGSKSGPNRQFFESLRLIRESLAQKFSAVQLLETDAVPIREGWIDLINGYIGNLPDFWVAGARYQGKSRISPAIASHFNGNAIYGIGCSGFDAFMQGWDATLRRCVAQAHWIAYDICLEWLTNHPQIHKSNLPEEIRWTIKEYKSMFIDISHVILNISGAEENQNGDMCLDKISGDHVIVHSRPLLDNIEWGLAGSSIDLERLSFQHPLNRRIAALERSPLSYFSLADPSSFSERFANSIMEGCEVLEDQLAVNIYKGCLATPPSSSTSS
jgi:hypothetical protein